MKILLLDLETSPNTAYVWGLWNQNIAPSQLIDTGEVMCWAAKWLGEEEVFFDSYYHHSSKVMLKTLFKMVDEADAVITYNGMKFDVPVMNKEFLQLGIIPTPHVDIDLYRTMKGRFRFASNKLDHICDKLGLGKKHNTNFTLWIDCMRKDPVAWEKMMEYNIQDVFLLEKLYYKVRPWIRNHPNVSVYSGDLACPRCGSSNLIRRGWHLTRAGKYKRYSCKDCGGPVRDNKAEKQTEKYLPL